MIDTTPAFPCTTNAGVASRNSHGQRYADWPGMTLRDHFAGLALQGMLAGLLSDGSHLEMSSFASVSQQAFMFADAMLKARGEQ